jgi:radical SAM protein with 4Fe4S-binding SPASM domain
MFFEQLQEKVTEIIFKNSVFGLAPLAAMPISNFCFPFYIQVEPTTKCNLRCNTCRRTNNVNCDMSIELFKSIISKFNSSELISRNLDLTGLGEPILHPKIANMVHYAKTNGFHVSFTSNFTLINDKNAVKLIKAQLDDLYVSVDGATKKTFEEIRVGADFDKVVENLKLFKKIKQKMGVAKPRLIFETTVSEANAHEIPKIVKLAESLGVYGILFCREVKAGKTDYKNDSFASINWKELTKSSVKIQVPSPERPPRPCKGVVGCYITFDGKVLPCNRIIQLVPRSEYSCYQFGDLNEKSLREIWFSKNYKLFRKRVSLGMCPSSLCKSCPTYASIN